MSLPSRRLLSLAGGVVTLHTAVTVLEEALYASPRFRAESGSAFMTLVFYTLATIVYLPSLLRPSPATVRSSSSSRRRCLLFLVATMYVATTTLSKTALAYIDLPTQTILKSAKLIPVMVGSLFIVGRAFAAHEWLAAVMLVSGICVFSLSNGGERTAHDGQHDSIRGVGCVLLALVCDALLGNTQQRVLSDGVSVPELMFTQSLAGMGYMLCVCAVAGSLRSGGMLLAAGGRDA